MDWLVDCRWIDCTKHMYVAHTCAIEHTCVTGPVSLVVHRHACHVQRDVFHCCYISLYQIGYKGCLISLLLYI